MNRTKPAEIFSLMEVGLAAVVRRMASKLCLMSETWVSTELLYNSTPIGSERKRQLNPLLGGGCWLGGGAAWRDDPGEEACMGKKTSIEHVERKCSKIQARTNVIIR